VSETENKENGESRNPESNPRPEGRQRPPRHAQQGGDDNAPQASGDAPQGDNGEPRSNDGNSDGSNRQQRHEGGGRRERGQRPQRGQRHHQQPQPQQDDETYETREGPRSGIVIDLNELKRKPPTALIALADDLGIQEGVARARKQDVIFLSLKAHARAGGGIYGEGVL